MRPTNPKKTGKPAHTFTTVQVCDALTAGQCTEAGNKTLLNMRSMEAIFFYDNVMAGELPQ